MSYPPAFQRIVRLVTALTVALAIGAAAQPASAAAARRSTRPAISTAAKTTKKPSTTIKTRRYASGAKSRAARLAQARAAARAKEMRDVTTPRYKIDASGEEVPDVRAEAAIIYNPETNQVLWESNAQEERSIASITKVMTAIVTLESGLPLTTPTTIQRADVYNASTTYLRAGYQVTADDLLNLLLIGSDNAAARALARISPYGSSGFVDQMNQKALELGLEKTHYADPSGLLATNVSSAYDMARLIAFAAGDERVGSVMRKATHTVYAGSHTINVRSTNHLVREGDVDVLGGKTGFIGRAGYCLATLLRLPQNGQQVAVVVLGARSNQGRFWETRHLFNWLNAHTSKLFGIAQPSQQQNESDKN
ncbi:MAG TPA: serine hydrolase [Vicinamibacterales bacterium]|nr:serine hydrolase [Vicinamibacterales bacterium]